MIGRTQMQDRCLDALRAGFERDGVCPSYRQIADALGLKATSGVGRLLRGLEERGAIRRLPHRARAIEIVAAAPRTVEVNKNLWPMLVRYCLLEKVNLQTAVNDFIRNGLESA